MAGLSTWGGEPVGGLVFFDVDGTLVPDTSTSQHLARWLGHFSELSVAEAAYAAGTLSNRDVSVRDASAWRGRTRSEVHDQLAGLPLVDGIAETVDWCRAHGLEPYLATLAWEPVGQYLTSRFGFAGCCGPTLATADGRFTGEVASHFDEYDKRDFAVAAAVAVGVPLAACAAVGDSRSDLPLFAAVGLPIAFNGSCAVRAAAACVVDGTDLRAVLPYLEDWLGTRTVREGLEP